MDLKLLICILYEGIHLTIGIFIKLSPVVLMAVVVNQKTLRIGALGLEGWPRKLWDANLLSARRHFPLASRSGRDPSSVKALQVPEGLLVLIDLG